MDRMGRAPSVRGAGAMGRAQSVRAGAAMGRAQSVRAGAAMRRAGSNKPQPIMHPVNYTIRHPSILSLEGGRD